MLKENNARKVFLDPGDFIVLRDKLPDCLKAFASFAYKTGRRKSETRNLEWKQFNLERGTVGINPARQKTKTAALLSLIPNLLPCYLQNSKRESTFVLLCSRTGKAHDRYGIAGNPGQQRAGKPQSHKGCCMTAEEGRLAIRSAPAIRSLSQWRYQVT
jgi:site-specific recombinase XerC